LIAPIQALAQRDSQMAMLLFDSLFVSILSEVFYLKDENEAQTTIKNIEYNMNSMLNSSESYNPNFVACILEIALKHVAKFRLDVTAISNACLNSLQQSLGIILIEEYIVLNEHGSYYSDGQPKAKRLKLASESSGASTSSPSNSEESILWIELAKLYRSMNDYDSIKGIFMRKKNLTTEFTRNGFYHESNNDYYQARKCYIDAINYDWSAAQIEIPQIEDELWQQSLLRCCNELTDWKTMCEYSTCDTTLKKLFKEDNYSMEYIFPYAFRSKVKLILQEDIAEQKKHQDLITFLNELEPDDKKYLEQGFCLEMALINLHQKDFNAAKYYAHLAIQKYLMVILRRFATYYQEC
jgi:DNA-dependent protein kinase catalytic subunit